MFVGYGSTLAAMHEEQQRLYGLTSAVATVRADRRMFLSRLLCQEAV